MGKIFLAGGLRLSPCPETTYVQESPCFKPTNRQSAMGDAGKTPATITGVLYD
jgi:hypothetical protein